LLLLASFRQQVRVNTKVTGANRLNVAALAAQHPTRQKKVAVLRLSSCGSAAALLRTIVPLLRSSVIALTSETMLAAQSTRWLRFSSSTNLGCSSPRTPLSFHFRPHLAGKPFSVAG